MNNKTEDGQRIDFGFSFRGAGHLIARLREDKEEYGYMKFYCSGPYAEVASWIEDALAEKVGSMKFYDK